MLNVAWLQFALLAVVLAIASAVDVRSRIIPNWCIAVAALIRMAVLATAVFEGSLDVRDACYYCVSAVGVAAFLIVFTLGFDRLTNSQGLGGGDIKLYAVAALYVGWELGVCVIAASCLLGAAWGAISALKAKVRNDEGGVDNGEGRPFSATLPFGPFISCALLATLAFAS